MPAIVIFKKQVFLEREIISGVEIVILIGFISIFLFNIASFLWVLTRLLRAGEFSGLNIATLVLGAACLVLMFGEKVMADEIGREYLLGWEVLGEWIILYVFLAVQLVYNSVVLVKLFRAYHARNAESQA